MYEAKDKDGNWWRFYNKPTLSDEGWVAEGHFSSLPNREDTQDNWEESLVEI